MEATKELNVALFENRHLWPDNVTEYLYDDRPGGYDQRDFSVFDGIAILKFIKWQLQGVEVVNLYLSGLVCATISALNAAYSVGIYVRLFHYSNISNTWLPQNIDFLEKPSWFNNKQDEEVIESDKTIKEDYSVKEQHLITSYVNVFNTLYNHFDPDRFTWEDVYSYIMREYSNINKEYIMLMKPYFEKNNTEKESYTDVIRRRIENDRGKQTAYPIHKLTTNRNGKRKYHRIGNF